MAALRALSAALLSLQSGTAVPYNAQITADSLLGFFYNHYHSTAYATVITAYVFGLGEYAVLRMKSLIWPERQVHFSNCEKRSNELVGKTAYHYAVVLLAFVVVALCQLVCFLGLTISSKWMYATTNEDFDRFGQIRQELAARIRSQMYAALFPTFVCYILCAVSILVMIYYMDGIQDALDITAASVLLYAFDAAIISYFLAFPLINCIYRRGGVTLRNRKDDQNNNVLYMVTTDRRRPVASTISSGLDPVIFSRRYSYKIANDNCDHERIRLSTYRTPLNFVRNTKLTTTV